MKTSKLSLAIFAVGCMLTGHGGLLAQPSGSATGPNNSAPFTSQWPRTFVANGAQIVVYEPQLRSWRNFRTIIADTAVSITPRGGETALGVISWRAETITEVAAKRVDVENIRVLSARFPYLEGAQETAMQQRVHQFYPRMALTFDLDRMIAALEKMNVPQRAVHVSINPPTILVSYSPAILLMVEGKPVLAPIQNTRLKYVINTSWNLFYDGSDYYLLDGKTWLKSRDMRSGWRAAKKLPADMMRLPSGQGWDDVIRAVPPSAGSRTAPKVFFTERPAELVVFKGRPSYEKIPGTNLSYATNTGSSVFLHRKNHHVYVLISGRWFRALSLQGPWTYAGNNLPVDFARIPPGHPYSYVLASVPGTQEANDAVLLAQVPTTAVVNRSAAESRVKVRYAGEPQFKPIENTTLFYAVNTADKVIRVGDRYYLCFQGVWFVSSTPMGRWKTATSIPQVIYTIPVSSPVYNVTYVKVLNVTPTTVVTSYSSGYLGMFVVGGTTGVTVVYGTGYYYPPYVYWGPHPVFFPYPYTYGVAAVYNPYIGIYSVGSRVYGPYAATGTAAWYNAATGTYARTASFQGIYGGRTYAQAYNPWTGTYAATAQGHNAYSQWGSSVVTKGNSWARSQHVTNSRGTAASFETSRGAAGAGFSGAGGKSGFVTRGAKNNVYAGADGNVYKKDSSGTWSKWDNGNWTPVQPPGRLQSRESSAGANKRSAAALDSPALGEAGRDSSTLQQLRNDSAARERGNQLQRLGTRGWGSGGGFRRSEGSWRRR